MLGYMLTTLAEANGENWTVRSAGTHVIEGSAMSGRTRHALAGIEELGAHHFNAHRSHQLGEDDVAWTDLIVTAEASHVRYVRSHFRDGADKTVVLAQFIRAAPLGASWREQIRDVAEREPLDDFDVSDPAGGEQVVYDECARHLWSLAQAFAVLVGAGGD